jgi:diguanylate cyclase (GGDEF)-like protein
LSPEQIRYNRLTDIACSNQDNIVDVLAHDRVVFNEERDVFVAEESWLNVDGRELYWQSHYTPLKFHDESVVLVVSTDISDRKKNEADIAYMAYHDPLTGLPNRLQLVERLENELHRAARHKYFGAVLFIDLDQFKYINDSLGHPVGDVVLKEVAHRLERSVREEDLVARLGGDEFVLVLTVLDTKFSESVKKASEIIDKVRSGLAVPITHDNMDLRVTCSVGAVMFPDGNVSVHELLRFADTAMYQVKEGGRNGIAFFNEAMAEQAKNQLLLEGELHKALAANQYELFYQAKVDVETGLLTGAEALLRWNHPERGYVSPGVFISVLESSGMIIEVGQWILEEACRSLLKWQSQGIWNDDMCLSINISPRQFRRSDFVNEVKNTLVEIPVHRGTLDIEITESVVIGNVEETIQTMEELALTGISFSLDDFGTGYSSISYLKRLPVSTLKIDQSFIRDISADRSDKVLVESMTNMGRLLGLKVVAEGVEEAEQLDLIREFGCDEYQGYYFSRPIPADEFCKLLSENSAKNGLKVPNVV